MAPAILLVKTEYTMRRGNHARQFPFFFSIATEITAQHGYGTVEIRQSL